MLNVNRLRLQDLDRISSNSLFVQAASAIAIAVGGLVLLGWCFDIQLLKSGFWESMATMKANTALCFILSGISLWLSLIEIKKKKATKDKQDKINPSPCPLSPLSGGPTFPLSLLSKVCALMALIIGSLTLCEYLFGWNIGIDELLFRDNSPIARSGFHPGRMGLNTALNFMLVGRSLELLVHRKTDRSYWYAQILTLIAGIISLQAIVGYAYKVKIFYGVAPYTTAMGLHTALVFIVLCIGIFWLRSDQGLMRVIMNNTYGSMLARRLLIAAIALPFFLGWLILQGQQAGLYDPAFAISLFAMILIVAFAVLIWQSTNNIESLSNERDRATDALRLNEDKLRSFVNANVIGILFGDVDGDVHQANDEFLRMIGYTRSELQAGKINWTNITPPEYQDLDTQRVAEAKTTGACTPYEKEYIRKDNSRVPVFVGYALLGEERRESVAFILDLSDRKQTLEALCQSEERFRLAVDNIPDIFTIYDAQRRIQFVNAAGLHVTNKSNEEVIGRTDEEIFPSEVTNAYLPTLIQAQETRTLQTIEATLTLPERGTFITQIKYVPILDKNGELYQILGVAEDITVRKQAESALQNQQKWLEDALNLMPTPLLFIEPGTARVTFANRAADELAGGEFPKGKSAEEYQKFYYCTNPAGDVSRQALSGLRLPSEQMPGVRVARGERLEGVEINWHAPNGVRPILIYADTLPAMHGHPATCVMAFQDITKLKNVEKALLLGNKRLQLLFDSASSLLSSQHPVALIESLFSKLAEQIGLDVYLNYLVDEDKQVMQLASYSGISEELAKEIEWLEFGQAMCGSVAVECRPIAIENVQQSTDPKTELIRALCIKAYYGYPLIARGRLVGTLSFGSCSQLRFSENQKGMMQAVCDQIAIAIERAELIASLQQQTQQLTEANRMKDEFLAVLSHELRSPLNAILGWAQLLRSRNLQETQKAKALETIERNARVQTQLVEDLLDISRMIQGKLRLNIRNCELVPIIESALDSVGFAANAKEIQIVADLDHSIGRISGDAGRLQQVIWNLLSNAIKFTPKGGRVEVRLSAGTGHEAWENNDAQSPIPNAQITVSDTGIGINPDFLPYVFDRFRQADSSSTRSHGGLGLGLAIVRQLVELHGGSVHVESPGEGQGATFTVKLPLLNMQEEQTDKHTRGKILSLSPPPQVVPSCFPSLDGVRVLVVDDEADTRNVITTVLLQCQAKVQAVESVSEALEVIHQWKPDVLVSDIGMPEEDGYSLIRKVRSQPPEQGGKIPAAALTAYARVEDRMRAIKEGYQLHLPKPIEPAELATVVASLVGRN